MNIEKRIVFVRSLKGFPDSRLEKEVYALSKKNKVFVFGWDREREFSGFRETQYEVFGKKITFFHVGIEAAVGKGFSKLLFPMLKFWYEEYKFLINNRDNFDMIHACDFDTALVAFLVAKKIKKKIVYDIFDYYADSHAAPLVVKKLIKAIDDKLIGKCDAVIICSELRREQIKDASPKKLCIIHNTPNRFCNKNDSVEIEKQSNAKIKLVYIGLLSRDRFLEEIAETVAERGDIEWHVGGWGVLESFLGELSKENKKIVYYGKISYESVLKLEKQCDIMTALYDPILPNHHYAAPNKFYEALMLGKPLIMIKNTGMDQYITGYGFGEVLDLENDSFKDAFNKALDNLIAKRGEWKKMAEDELRLYQTEFSWDKMEKRLIELYSDI